jgi:hypothetical protein
LRSEAQFYCFLFRKSQKSLPWLAHALHSSYWKMQKIFKTLVLNIGRPLVALHAMTMYVGPSYSFRILSNGCLPQREKNSAE